ncbi:MAG: UvrB/UvrC motif-containing protein, partial [Deltaproteobacteria bacterium]|nr:UvrB/UvrC motif-containing protein [Deltaproteobacteria bacterium]
RDAKETKALIDKLRHEMFRLAKALDFEAAAQIRDQLTILERYLLSL